MATFMECARWMLSALGVDVGTSETGNGQQTVPEIQHPKPPEKPQPPPDTEERDIAAEVLDAENRLYKRLDEGADRPSLILQHRSYVGSEIRALKQRIERYAPEEEKAELRDRVQRMSDTIEQTEAAGLNRALKALRKDIEAAREAVELATSLATMDAPKDAYKLASAGAARVFLSETEWKTQLKIGRSLPGIDTLAGPLQELSEQCRLLDDLVGNLLPKPKSRATPLPPDDNVAEAPQEFQIVEGKELQAIRDCGGDWADAKAKYGRYKKEMQKLAKFRKDVVDQWLKDELTKWGMSEGTGLGWVAVGSKDPTSDYDISINQHGRMGEGPTAQIYYDYKIVKDFNAYFRKTYKCETGTIFDTNLYAAAPPLNPEPDPNGSEKEKQAHEQVVASNDIGALMKQRRYMSAEEFLAYREEVLEGLPEPARSKMDQRFEMAETHYLISLETTVSTMRRLLEKAGPELSEGQQKAAGLLREFDEKMAQVKGSDLIEGTAELEHLAHELMHSCKDVSTMSTNEIYADSKGELREAEARVAQMTAIRKSVAEFVSSLQGDFDPAMVEDALQGLAATLDGLDKAAADHVRKGLASQDKAGYVNAMINVQDRLKEIAPELLSDLARAQALNMFYANEAYQSGGPFKHVVYAGQAVETDVKQAMQEQGITDEKLIKEEIARETQKRRASLTANERLDSFNEQLGDFLKDLAHYGDEDPGVAIIQSSKYLDRLIDAAALLNDKGLFDADSTLQKEILGLVARQDEIRKQLIGARKGLLVMEPLEEGVEINQVEERRAFACEFMRKMGISSVAALGRTYSQLGIRVNVAVRKQLPA